MGQEIDGGPAFIEGSFSPDDFPRPIDGVLHLVAVYRRLAQGGNISPRGLEGDRHEFGDPSSAIADRLDAGYSKNTGELRDVQFSPRALELVEHVERQHAGFPDFDDLGGQIEIPLQLRGVRHDDHRTYAVGEEFMTRHFLVRGAGRKAVGSRKIGEGDLGVINGYRAFLLFHGDARIIADMLARAGYVIKKAGFSAIRVARQRDDYIISHCFGTPRFLYHR